MLRIAIVQLKWMPDLLSPGRRSRRSDGIVSQELAEPVRERLDDDADKEAPTASTSSGSVITDGDSWAWWPASSGTLNSPQNVRK